MRPGPSLWATVARRAALHHGENEFDACVTESLAGLQVEEAHYARERWEGRVANDWLGGDAAISFGSVSALRTPFAQATAVVVLLSGLGDRSGFAGCGRQFREFEVR